MRFFATVAVCLCCTLGFTQDCSHSLTGTVIDQHDSTALAGATLFAPDLGRAVFTDLDGNFTMEGLCQGRLVLVISHPICDTQQIEVVLPYSGDYILELEHHVEALEEVTVVGSSFTTKTESILENRIELESIEQFSHASFGDVLNTLSGVSSLNTGSTVVKPMINGLHSSRVTIINNGVRMQDQEWGAEHAPNIDVNTAGAITVIKGASALQYTGDAIGGVIISEPARIAAKDSIYGKTILSGATNGRGGSASSSLTLSRASGWFGTAQGTLKRFGDFEAPDYVLSNTGTYERDFSLRGGFNTYDQGVEGYYSFYKNDIGILRASHLGGAADLVEAIESPVPLIIEDFTYDIGTPRQEVTHHLGRVTAFKRFDHLGKLSLTYNLQHNQRFEYDVRRGDREDIPAVDLELTTHLLSLDLESKLGNDTKLKTGISGVLQDNFADPTTGVRRLIPDYDQYQFGVYGILDTKVNDNTWLEVGARFDHTHLDALKFYRTSFWEERGYDQEFADLVVEDFGTQVLTNPVLDYSNFSATAGVNYQFDEHHVLFANYALASRAPNPSELFSEGLHHGASRIELGDLRFGSEVGNKFSVTFQRKASKWNFSLNPYFNLIQDFIILEPTGVQQTIRGSFQVWEYRQTDATLAGVDFDLDGQITSRLLYRNKFSYVYGQDRDKETALINMPPPNVMNALEYSFPNFHNLSFRIQSDYVFEQKRYPDTNFEVFIPDTGETKTVDVSTPPDAYHLLELGASATFPMGANGSQFNVGLTVANALDTSYRNYLNRLRYYADDLGRNIILNLKFNY